MQHLIIVLEQVGLFKFEPCLHSASHLKHALGPTYKVESVQLKQWLIDYKFIIT